MERLRNPAIWILVVASLLPVWAVFHVDHEYLDDDALITLTYAKNLARGDGFVFNHPPPVLGTTTPLYAMIVAGLAALLPFIQLTAIAVSFSAACWIGVVWAVFGFRRQLGLDDLQAASVGLVVIATGWVGHLEMEAYLFALLLMVSVGLYSGRRLLASGAAAGLLFLTRGEGALLFAILLMMAAFRDFRDRRQTVPSSASAASVPLCVGFAVPVLLWSAYAQLTFGSVLPNTLAAKIAQGSSGLWQPFLAQLIGTWAPTWGRQLWLAGMPLLNLWYALVVFGLVVAVRSARPLLVPVAWTACYVIGYSALGVAGYPWYGLPVLFTLSLLFGLGLAAAVGFVSRLPFRHHAAVIAATVLTAVVIARLATPTVRTAIATEPSERKIAYRELAHWLDGHAEPRHSIGYHEIGYLGYYTDLRIVDLMGLVTPDVTPMVAEGDFAWGFWHHRPDYFVHLEGSGFQTAIVSDPRFAAGYRTVVRLPGFNARSLTVYRHVQSE
jgi:hypothetical protein